MVCVSGEGAGQDRGPRNKTIHQTEERQLFLSARQREMGVGKRGRKESKERSSMIQKASIWTKSKKTCLASCSFLNPKKWRDIYVLPPKIFKATAELNVS